MNLESVVCVILHCSRCNDWMRNDESESPVHWDSPAEVDREFNREGLINVFGWRRFKNRYICYDCQSFDDESGDPIENPAPLSAAEVDEIAREQASYANVTLALLPRPSSEQEAS